MFYKLSNTADLQCVEEVFNTKFKYPSLYKKTMVINGLAEESLPIITSEENSVINYGIWGLMPEQYKDEWENFQNLDNTLDISLCDVNESDWIKNIFLNNHCLIIITGFFTSYLYDGEVYPYYVHLKDSKPFAVAGIFSKLKDGFISVSLLTSAISSKLATVHNLGKEFPIILESKDYYNWLNDDLDIENLDNRKYIEDSLEAYTISKDFFKNNIVYDTVLEPVNYKNLPIPLLK